MAQVDRAAEEAEAVAGTFLEKAGHVGTAGNHHHNQLPKLELGLLPMPISAFFHKPPDTTHVAVFDLLLEEGDVMRAGELGQGQQDQPHTTAPGSKRLSTSHCRAECKPASRPSPQASSFPGSPAPT